MGQHVWLLLATIATELLVIKKWSKGQFPAPLPTAVKWGWVIGATLLVLYPTIQVCTSVLLVINSVLIITRSPLVVRNSQRQEIYQATSEEG